MQPIIPVRRKEPFDDPDWLFDFKYDGYRGLCIFDRGRARNGNWLDHFAHSLIRWLPRSTSRTPFSTAR
ncbi:MAG: hypothetical protein J2P48_20420 [Alphaproteobacteria bacterium]|nr:hypothetical protein [Alphaproteobacteria bacterium]